MSTSRVDLLKASAKRGRACCNSKSSRQADAMDVHQIRTKAMVLGLEDCLTWRTYRSNKTQHRNRVNLEVTQSLNQTLGRNIDFHHALYEFFSGVPSNDEGNRQDQSLFQHILRVEQFAFH